MEGGREAIAQLPWLRASYTFLTGEHMKTKTARTLTVAEVKSIMSTLNGSGHDIVSPEELIKEGVPTHIVKSLTQTFRSDMSDPKSAIFVDGKLVKSLRGVHSLRLYEEACSILNLEYKSYYGRGSQAQACHEALKKWVEVQSD